MDHEHSLLCLDIGNTSCRAGIWKNGALESVRSIFTTEFIEYSKEWINDFKQHSRIAYCSVVPLAESAFLSRLPENYRSSVYQLTSGNQSILPISYPHPEEIGSDRIANSIAAFKLFRLPSIIIDLGTATTFDVISVGGGYEGGIIIPGPQGMLDFLGNHTALLPKITLSNECMPDLPVGKSTSTAMLSGIKFGYLPMLNGILDVLQKQFLEQNINDYAIIQTGGKAEDFLIDKAIFKPWLTLEGLATACLDNSLN